MGELARSGLGGGAIVKAPPASWTILSNTPDLQAVAHRGDVAGDGGALGGSEVIHAIFWRQGALPPTAETLGLSVQSGMLVMTKLHSTSGSLSITASDPRGTTQTAGCGGEAEVVVTGSFVGENCTAVAPSGGAAASTKFSFGVFGSGNEPGRSTTIVCTRKDGSSVAG
jgi:hypothetical protein